jgi:hypothetical protein
LNLWVGYRLLKMKRKRSKKKTKDIWSLKRWNFQPIEPTNHLNLKICNSRKKRNEKVLMKSRPLILIPDLMLKMIKRRCIPLRSWLPRVACWEACKELAPGEDEKKKTNV